MLLLLLLLVTLIGLISLECFGFSSSFNPTERTYSFPPSDPSGRLIYVKAFETQEATAAALCHDLWSHAKNILSNREFFHAAVPGGSVLKMLSGLSKYREELWWDRVCLYYVNHKVVSAEDSSSTHMKAQKYFLNEIPSIRVASLSGMTPFLET